MIARNSLEERSAESALEHRPRLLGLAYRMLGDMDEAEDVVQEAYLNPEKLRHTLEAVGPII
jgi:RNA polymerase sigma-70 factor (ECF subfamily)